MFKSAVLKLTAWYVGALVFVCLCFSIPAYNIAAARLQRGAERQTDVIRHLPFGAPTTGYFSQLEELREKQLGEDRQQLLRTLFIYNALIVLLGAGASYWFARRTLRPIEETHLAQSRFTSDASHELRTPLATMQAEIDVALRDKSLKLHEARAILQSNLEEVARLQLLSEQLLSLTRLSSRQDSFKPIDLAKLVGGELQGWEKSFAFAISLKGPKKVMVSGDAALLQQVISILVSNAVTYANGVDPKIRISLGAHKKFARLAVADQGPGIDPQDLPRIFDRFYRGSNATKSGVAGHGIGLALAKQIVELHDGSINVASGPKGTTFTIELPRLTSRY